MREPYQIQEQIYKQANQDYRTEIAEAAEALSPRLKGAANQLLVLDNRAEMTPIRELDNEELQRLLDLLFGEAAELVQTAIRHPGGVPRNDDGFRFRATDRTQDRLDYWLRCMVNIIGPYPRDRDWLFTWGQHLVDMGHGSWVMGHFYTSLIDAGGEVGDQLYDTLLRSVRGKHELGALNTAAAWALNHCARTEAHEAILEILAEPRDEGDLEPILMAVFAMELAPFCELIRCVLDNDLCAYPTTIQCLNSWFEFSFRKADTKKVAHLLDHCCRSLADRTHREKLLRESQAQETFMALWAVAYLDAGAAIESASEVLKSSDPERRFAATDFLLGTLSSVGAAVKAAIPAAGDEDRRVAARALDHFHHYFFHATDDMTNLFGCLEKALEAAPDKPQKVKNVVWPWGTYSVHKRRVADSLPRAIASHPARRLLPYYDMMSSEGHGDAHAVFARQFRDDAEVYAKYMEVVSRGRAIETLKDKSLRPSERSVLVGLMSQKADRTRSELLAIFKSWDDETALGTAQDLLAAKSPQQRLGGLELLRDLMTDGRREDECVHIARLYQSAQKVIPGPEKKQLEAILADRSLSELTIDDALGLLDPAQVTQAPVPEDRGAIYVTPAAEGILVELMRWYHDNQETRAPGVSGDGRPCMQPLKFRAVPEVDWSADAEEDCKRLQPEVAWPWLADRGDDLRDPDGFEVLRALWGPSSPHRREELREKALGPGVSSTYYCFSEGAFLKWILRRELPQCACLLLDMLETAIAVCPRQDLGAACDDLVQCGPLLRFVHDLAGIPALGWRPEHDTRLFNLMLHVAQTGPAGRSTNSSGLKYQDEPSPPAGDVLAAFAAGGANEHDILRVIRQVSRHLDMGPGVSSYFWYSDLFERNSKLLQKYPQAAPIVERYRDRLIEVEMSRGTEDTVATWEVRSLPYTGDLATLRKVLRSLGDEKLQRKGKGAALAEIIRKTHPSPDDTPEAFAEMAGGLGVSADRLLQLAFWSPQWLDHICHTMGWDGLRESVLWVAAHARDRYGEQKPLVALQAKTSHYTELSLEKLNAGAADAGWFLRSHEKLGAKRWDQAYAQAEYISNRNLHARVRRFADAILGKLAAPDLMEQINSKRSKDAVCALGLIPLAEGEVSEQDLLDRYRCLQDFVRGSAQFGAQRRASEREAGEMGIENLARRAGYRDPLRLQWAMEALECRDLATGPVEVSEGKTVISLSLDEWGRPQLDVTQDGKSRKAVPAAVKKKDHVKALLDRKEQLGKSASLIRDGLEWAMVMADDFSPEELRTLMANPILAPNLRDLILVSDTAVGYPQAEGRKLRDSQAQQTAVGTAPLRIAHPLDLLLSGSWDDWQRDCFSRRLVQPFKQVFRELYIPLDEELRSDQVLRYDQGRFDLRRGAAILKGRGWVTDPDSGYTRTFLSCGITAWMVLDEPFFFPDSNLSDPAIEDLYFSPAGSTRPMKLDEVPAGLFSEVMRDIDLVLSVAHTSGPTREASASTMDSRAALIARAVEALGIKNTEREGNHVHVKGERNTYRVHLGSGITHLAAGPSIYLAAAPSEDLFLPFADDDPVTAEVLSKVLLLSQDGDIEDTEILRQVER